MSEKTGWKIKDRELRIEDRWGSEIGFRGSKIGILDPGFGIGYCVSNCMDVKFQIKKAKDVSCRNLRRFCSLNKNNTKNFGLRTWQLYRHFTFF